MVKTVDVSETQISVKELLSLIDEGTEIVLTEGSTPLARLVAIAPAARKRTPGLHPGPISMSDDFDAPLPEELWEGGA